MPAVARTLKDKFGWDAKLSDPNQAVAKGAAIYGSAPWSAHNPFASQGFRSSALKPTPDRLLAECRLERPGGRPIVLTFNDGGDGPTSCSVVGLPGSGPVRLAFEVFDPSRCTTSKQAVMARLPGDGSESIAVRFARDELGRPRLTARVGAMTAEFVVPIPRCGSVI